jgi:signal transduction histidine kinase
VLALLLAVYSVAAQGDARRAVLGGLLVVVGGIAYSWVAWTEGDTLVDVGVPFLFFAAAWAAGREVGHQRLRAAELASRTALLEHAREREAQLAVAEERARIARELHDVVAHGVGVMGVQAAAARRTLEPRQDSQREALLTVERIGREALAELQRMLGVLRSTGQAIERAPYPSLARLPELVGELRRASLAVELTVEGEVCALAPGLELSAYRIVQEALTNTRKYAPGATARVTVRYKPASLELAVSDDGPGPAAGGSDGHGLVGMRERASLHGGELRAGPGPDGGFLVEARLPLHTAP